jgi:alkylation response protein AidB-like acyl-CoA dehydrogenase
MDFSYTPEQRELQARAAAFTARLMEHEVDVELSNGQMSIETQRELTSGAIEAGLWAMNMPREWGGAELSTVEQIIVQEQIGKATNCLWDFVWYPANVLARCTDEQREKYLLPVIRGEKRDAYATTEADAGSDAAAISTTATRTEGGWLLNGEKWFVTCGDVADFLIVHALAGDDRQPTVFLVDKQTPGIETVHTPVFMHTPVFGHPQIGFTDVFVSDSDVLGEVGEGYELTKEWFVEERLGIAARTIGAAERALSLARDWAVEREQFGEPIAAFQMVQAMLADCAVDIAVNRAYYHQVAWEIDNGGDRKTMHAKASIAKLAASEAAGRVADRCLQIFGGRGYDRTFAVERIYREVRVDRIWEGTSEIQRLIVANELIKRGVAVLDMPDSAVVTR